MNAKTKIYVERVSSRPYYRSKTKPNEKKPVLREGVACRENCQRYPCFKGIENLETNFAQTCHDYKRKIKI